MKRLIFLFVILAVSGFLIVRKNATKPAKQSNSPAQAIIKYQPQEKEETAVTVKVTPKNLKTGEKPVFEIEFTTHSVELAFDVAKISYLVDDGGNKISSSVWQGSPPRGHHRSGKVTFNVPLSPTAFVELVIQDVAGVSERKFRWEL